MKIAFDYQAFAMQQYGGISRYFVRLAQELVRLGEDAHIVAPLHQNRYLGELEEKRVYGREVSRFPRKTGPLIRFANRMLGSRWCHQHNPDLIHETYYSARFVGAESASRVVTVYDMIHEKYSDQFPARDRTTSNKRNAIARADQIVSISNSTKNDLCELFDVPEEKVSVVHLGYDKHPTAMSQNAASHQAQRTYLLYVGSRCGYKNFDRMLRAVASRKSLGQDFDIIAFGGGPFRSSELRLISTLGLQPENVRQLGGGDEILGQLYRSAAAFVYPSLYEGFGLPPLEAMAQECPVVSSNTSSMPEIVGDAGEYFDPSDVDAQAEAIEAVVFNVTRRSQLIERGKERLNHFSWHQCALQTRDVYRKANDKRGRA